MSDLDQARNVQERIERIATELDDVIGDIQECIAKGDDLDGVRNNLEAASDYLHSADSDLYEAVSAGDG